MNKLENVGPASKVFEAEFRRQILASERERASLQALIAVALLLVVAVVDAVYIATGNPLPAFKAALLVVTAVIVYEWAMRELFDRYFRQDRQLPRVARYLPHIPPALVGAMLIRWSTKPLRIISS